MIRHRPHDQTPRTIAILPLGATEQHGPHLPADTDWIIAAAVAKQAADADADLDIRVLPVEKIGYSPEHSDFEVTRTLAYADAIEGWVSTARRIHAEDCRKLVMLNAHGGNSPLMTIAATEIRLRIGMLAVTTSWTRFGYPDDIVSAEERALGIHGGFIETSVMLALRPDLVDMAKARNFPSAQADFTRDLTHLRAYGPHAFGWMMRDLSPEGVVGDAAAASAQAGERILAHAVAGFVELLRDVDRFEFERLSTDADR